MRLVLPAERAGAAGAVDVGIRPESLRPVSGDDEVASSVRGIVTMVEPLGHEQYVHVDVGEASLVARLPREVKLALDEPVTFAVDAARCHLFDPGSGEVLR